MRPATLPSRDVCLGWAYEPCGEPAEWILREYWKDGAWCEHPLCDRHRQAVLDGADSESNPPQMQIMLKRKAAGTLIASPSAPSASATPLQPTGPS